MSDGFRSRVATNVVATPDRNPAAFRSGIAEGLSDVGQAMQQVGAQDAQLQQDVAASQFRIQQEQQRRQRSSVIADRGAALPEVQTKIETDLDALRTTPGLVPGTPDYEAKRNSIITDNLKGFVDTLGDDPDVRDRFVPLVANFGADTRLREQRWETAQKAKAEGQNIDTGAQALSGRLIGSPTPETLQGAFDWAERTVGGLDAPDTVRTAVIDQKKKQFTRDFFDGRLAQGDWQGTKALIDSGKFDTYLGSDKDQYLRKADIARQTAERQTELAASGARDDARDAIKTIEAKVDAGIAPPASDMRAVRMQAQKAGLDEADLVKFDALNIKVQVNQNYGGLIGQPGGADRIRRDRDQLSARIAGGKANESDQVMRAQLDKLVDTADKQEADAVREIAGKGWQGQMTALGMLGGTAAARYDKAEKLKPGLGIVAGLGPRAQSAALEGAAIREARKNDFGKPQDVDKTAKALLPASILSVLGPHYRDVADTAWSIMTADRNRRGLSGFDPGDYRDSLRSAMGATIRPGTGLIQGGVQRVRGAAVWLPAWQTAPEFDASISRQSFAEARYADGKPVPKADVLANYHPAYLRDDADGNALYHMLDANGGALRHADGSAFVIRQKH